MTIKCYISAIKAILMGVNVKINEDRYLLTSLTRACRLKNDCVCTRLPIHSHLLEVLLDKTQYHFFHINQPYLAALYRAMFASAYYGLLYVSEMTTGSHSIYATDVQIGLNKKKIMFTLHTSKNAWI